MPDMPDASQGLGQGWPAGREVVSRGAAPARGLAGYEEPPRAPRCEIPPAQAPATLAEVARRAERSGVAAYASADWAVQANPRALSPAALAGIAEDLHRKLGVDEPPRVYALSADMTIVNGATGRAEYVALRERAVPAAGDQVVARTQEWMVRTRQALASDHVPDPAAFDPAERRAYEVIVRNGNTETDARKLAPLLAEAQRDPVLQRGLGFGTEVGRVPFGGRPLYDGRARRAYDEAFAQLYTEGHLMSEADARGEAYKTSLLTAVAAEVDAVDAYLERRGIENVRPELLARRNAMAAALVDADVYFDLSIPEMLPRSLRRREETTYDDNGPTGSGFFGTTYGDKVTGNVFVADRGTEQGIATRREADWTANSLQAVGLRSEQYESGVRWARTQTASRWVDDGAAARFIFTGHSLGGGLASAQAETIDGSQGITFNAAGLHRKTLERYSGAELGSNRNIQAYFVKGEALSRVQDEAVTPAKLGLLAVDTPASIAAGAALIRMHAGPRADGQRISLAAVSDAEWAWGFAPAGGLPFGAPGANHGEAGTFWNTAIPGQAVEVPLREAMHYHSIHSVAYALQPGLEEEMTQQGIPEAQEAGWHGTR